MATLVSPGVSVTITDESFFIPAAASTVPLFFIATASEKLQPNADPALGTYEHNVIRTITSADQAVRTYGTPVFREDSLGNPLHGDARNEYGLFALNQFLGVGNQAFVIRANVNLNDDRDSILDLWETKTLSNTTPLGVAYVLEVLVNEYLNEWNSTNGYIPTDSEYRITVDEAEFLDLADQALTSVLGKTVEGLNVYFEEATFKTTRDSFVSDHTSSPLNVYTNGYDQPPTDTFLGLEGASADWVTNSLGTVVADEWTSAEARDLMIELVSDFQYTPEFLNNTTLGANDAARRITIVEALAAVINSNDDIRSDSYEFNLVLCPGYHEVVDEMVALSTDLSNEVFVIADTPMNMNVEEVTAWASTSARQRSEYLAYYYPHQIASNLDGKEVFVPASGTALRTITVSDDSSQVWFAPAGTRRGRVTGISQVGYVTGTLGTATTFVELNLKRGAIDVLYQYFTNLNPIVFFPDRGILLWGQKTSANAASALDRINVARLMCYIKRQLRKNTMPFLFEPNDQLTRDNLKAAVDSFLSDIMVKRGLYDFATVCDETNNTPVRIDRNEMYIDVALKPTKAAEFLYIPIRILSTGAEL